MPRPKTSVLTAVASATIRGPSCLRRGSDGSDNEEYDEADDDEDEEYGDLVNGEKLPEEPQKNTTYNIH